jgi:hypothetical protein
MMLPLRTRAGYALRWLPGGARARLAVHSGLVREGWFRSYRAGRPVDRAGRPLPMYTYSAVHFLGPRLCPDQRVFEFGSGYSTLWYAERVREVVAVEHDAAWAEEVSVAAGSNVTVLHRSAPADYLSEIERHGRFQLVAIDGLERSRAAVVALDALRHDGVVILDNADNPAFREASNLLRGHGFRELPFDGMAPVFASEWRTSVFYRPGNCLGI